LFWDRRNHPWVGAGRDTCGLCEAPGGRDTEARLLGLFSRGERSKRCPFLQSRAECGQLFAFGREVIARIDRRDRCNCRVWI